MGRVAKKLITCPQCKGRFDLPPTRKFCSAECRDASVTAKAAPAHWPRRDDELRAHILAGRTCDETAALMGITKNSVWSRADRIGLRVGAMGPILDDTPAPDWLVRARNRLQPFDPLLRAGPRDDEDPE